MISSYLSNANQIAAAIPDKRRQYPPLLVQLCSALHAYNRGLAFALHARESNGRGSFKRSLEWACKVETIETFRDIHYAQAIHAMKVCGVAIKEARDARDMILRIIQQDPSVLSMKFDIQEMIKQQYEAYGPMPWHEYYETFPEDPRERRGDRSFDVFHKPFRQPDHKGRDKMALRFYYISTQYSVINDVKSLDDTFDDGTRIYPIHDRGTELYPIHLALIYGLFGVANHFLAMDPTQATFQANCFKSFRHKEREYDLFWSVLEYGATYIHSDSHYTLEHVLRDKQSTESSEHKPELMTLLTSLIDLQPDFLFAPHLPLHYLIDDSADVKVIDLFIAKNPNALSIKNERGKLPIDLVIESEADGMLGTVLKANTHALKQSSFQRDKSYASIMQEMIDPEVIHKLKEAYLVGLELGIYEPDSIGGLFMPVEFTFEKYFFWWDNPLRHPLRDDIEEVDVIETLGFDYHSELWKKPLKKSLLELFLYHYCQAGQCLFEKGWDEALRAFEPAIGKPILHAAIGKTDAALLPLLIDKFQVDLDTLDSKGRTALEAAIDYYGSSFASSSLSKDDEDAYAWFTAPSIRDDENSSVSKQTIDIIVERMGEAVMKPNAYGRSFLAIAASSGLKWHDGTESILKAMTQYKQLGEILELRDPKTGLYPFALAGVGGDIESAFELLAAKPDILESNTLSMRRHGEELGEKMVKRRKIVHESPCD